MHARFVAVIAAALVSVSSATLADPQPAPTPVSLPTMPPSVKVNPYAQAAIDVLTGIARQSLDNNANRAEGRVTYFRRFDLQVQTARNAYRNVHLHQGTRIDPRGATLQPGDHVSIGGAGRPDGSIDADAITILQE